MGGALEPSADQEAPAMELSADKRATAWTMGGALEPSADQAATSCSKAATSCSKAGAVGPSADQKVTASSMDGTEEKDEKQNSLEVLLRRVEGLQYEMDEKVDLVEVLTRRVEDLQRGETHITSVHCATQHKIVICTYFGNQCHHIS